MKSQIYLEYQEKKINDKELFDRVKDIWTSSGSKIKDIISLNIYVKPEENMVYYAINETVTGSFNL